MGVPPLHPLLDKVQVGGSMDERTVAFFADVLYHNILIIHVDFGCGIQLVCGRQRLGGDFAETARVELECPGHVC